MSNKDICLTNKGVSHMDYVFDVLFLGEKNFNAFRDNYLLKIDDPKEQVKAATAVAELLFKIINADNAFGVHADKNGCQEVETAAPVKKDVSSKAAKAAPVEKEAAPVEKEAAPVDVTPVEKEITPEVKEAAEMKEAVVIEILKDDSIKINAHGIFAPRQGGEYKGMDLCNIVEQIAQNPGGLTYINNTVASFTNNQYKTISDVPTLILEGILIAIVDTIEPQKVQPK